MAAERRTRVGFVGLNERAQRLLLRGLAASPRARLVAVCSRDPARARQVARSLGPAVRAFTRTQDMVGAGEVDAVFVNTPVATHFDLCMAAIDAGCSVICEKPLAAGTREAVALAAAAAAAGVRTAVNFTYRSTPGYRLTERLLAAPGIGRPLHAEFALQQGHNFLPSFPHFSALLDSGVHLFDTLAGLGSLAGLGPVTQVGAMAMFPTAPRLDRFEGIGPDFGWGFTARTASGALVSAAFSRSALGWRNGLRWSLYGEDGAISVELDADRTDARVARRGDGRPQGVWRPAPVPPDLQADDERFPEYHLDRLVAAVRGEAPFPGFEAAVATHRLADALAASAATGRVTTVEP